MTDYPAQESGRNPVVFLAHAGTDSYIARQIADHLAAHLLSVKIDVKDVEPGSNFVLFMMNALEESDYCLTLWSNNVKPNSFIGDEVAAAYVKSVKEKRAFLLFARLQDVPLPVLFASRVSVDLFPNYQPGLDLLVDVLHRDSAVRLGTRRGVIPLTSGVGPIRETQGGLEVYICSGVFDRTLVYKLPRDLTGMQALIEVVQVLGIPATISYNDRIGVKLLYKLRGPRGVLHYDYSLESQGVTDGTILWLEVQVQVFSEGVQVEGQDSHFPVFRDISPSTQAVSKSLRSEALGMAAEILSNSLATVGARQDSRLGEDALAARL